MGERDLWVLEDSTGPVENAVDLTLLAFSDLCSAAVRCEDGERVVRYVPAPEWRTGEPEVPGAYWVECAMFGGDWPWEMWPAEWSGQRWHVPQLGEPYAVRRWTELPQPPPWEGT